MTARKLSTKVAGNKQLISQQTYQAEAQLKNTVFKVVVERE
jgi:hypothetical protein